MARTAQFPALRVQQSVTVSQGWPPPLCTALQCYQRPSSLQAFYELVDTLHKAGAYQLITSRIAPVPSGPMGSLPQLAPDPVSLDGGLEIRAACNLLKHVCGRAAQLGGSQAQSIVSICERNPLLLQLLGGFMAEGEVTAQVRAGHL